MTANEALEYVDAFRDPPIYEGDVSSGVLAAEVRRLRVVLEDIQQSTDTPEFDTCRESAIDQARAACSIAALTGFDLQILSSMCEGAMLRVEDEHGILEGQHSYKDKFEKANLEIERLRSELEERCERAAKAGAIINDCIENDLMWNAVATPKLEKARKALLDQT